MAVLALAAGGAALGSALIPGTILGLTGASIGWTVGAIAGNLLFAPRVHTSGPRLQDLQTTTSTYGVALPTVYGTMRVAGNVIWADKRIEHEQTTRTGKGGGGTYTSYTYTRSLAIAICDGPILAVRRIWANGKLVYDNTSGAAPQTIASTQRLNDNITLYTGSATQLPSSVIEAIEGAGNVPGYRNVAYAVFRDLELQDYGNAEPNFEFEAIVDGAIICPSQIRNYSSIIASSGLASIGALQPTSAELRGDALILRSIGGVQYDVGWNNARTMQEVREATISANGDSVLVNGSNWLAPTLPFSTRTNSTLAGVCPNSVRWGQYAGYETDANNNLIGDPRVFFVDIEAGGAVGTPNLITGGIDLSNFVILNFDGHDWAYMIGANGVACVGRQQLPGSTDDPLNWKYNGADAASNAQNAIIASYSGDSWNNVAHIAIAADADNHWVIATPNGSTRMYVVDGVNMNVRAVFDTFYDFGGGPTGCLPMSAGGGRVLTRFFSGGQWNLAVFDVSASGGTPASPLALKKVSTTQPSTALTALTLPSPGSGISLASDTHLWRYTDAVADAPPTLQQVVERICVAAGYSLGEVDATSLAGMMVQGYVRRERMTGAAQLQPLTTAYGFDLAEVDGKVLARLRGATADAVVDASDLLGDATTPAVTSNRAQESELPRQLDVSYFSYPADYAVGSQSMQRIVTTSQQRISIDLPIVLSDTDAAKLCRRMLWEAWIGRTSRSFALGPKWSKLVPTDVITLPLPDGVGSATVRLTRVKRDGIRLDCESIDVDAAAFTQPSIAGTIPGVSTPPSGLAASDLLLLDIAPLRDEDNNYGLYAAVSAFAGTWPGAALFVSAGPDAPAAEIGFAGVRASFGYAYTALPDTSLGDGVIDSANTVDVDWLYGDLPASITADQQLASRDNTFLIGDEIVQARSVTVLAGNRLRLADMIRGVQGTQNAKATHVARERIIWLNSALVDVSLQPSQINVPATFTAVTAGAPFSTGRGRAITPLANRLKPLPPAQVRGIRLVNNDVVIAWHRRARIGNIWRGAVDVPLDEPSQQYEVEIISGGGAVLRTFTGITSQSMTYFAAQVLADFGQAVVDPIRVRVYQISSRVGRGLPADVLLAMPVTSLTLLLMHFDGINGSTVFADSSGYVWSVAPTGNAQISTAQSKFGGAAALFDGVSDYLTVNDNGALRLGTGDWTIDFWVRLAAYGSQGVISKRNSAGNAANTWTVFADNDGAGHASITEITGGGFTNHFLTSAISLNTWTHIEFSRSGNTIRGFFGGSKELEYTTSQNFDAAGFPILIGTNTTGAGSLNGYIDELRVRKEAVHTTNFTPPSSPYTG